MQRKYRLAILLAAFALPAIFGIANASAFVSQPTDTTTWRAQPAQAPCFSFGGIVCGDPNAYQDIIDRNGNQIKAGEWDEFIWRYGNDSSPMSSTRYNALTTAEKAFVDRVRDPATGSWSGQLNLWQTEEEAVQSKIASGAATSDAKAAISALLKERVALGLAPKIIAGGSIVFTVAQSADLVEKALVAGENKLFGWHIQLKGPFGIFGSWDPTTNAGTSQGTVAVTGVKWKPETDTVLCSVNAGCPVWDTTMDTATGATVGTLDGSTYKLWVLEPFVVFRNNLGNITSQQYNRDVDDALTCSAGSGYWSGSGTQSAYCSVGSEQLAYFVSEVYGSISPSSVPAIASNGGPNGSILVPAQPGNGLTIGQFVGTRDCSHGLHNECVAFTMTEAQMEKYLGMRNSSKVTQNYSWEKPASGSDATNWQGNIDGDQPASTFNPTLNTTVPAPLTDTQRDVVQKTSRDGTTDGDANQKDCYASRIPQAGVACPDPLADGFLVPSTCPGESVSTCVADLENVGFDGNHVDTTLARDSADLTRPASTVATINPAGGSTVAPDTTFDLEVNPAVMPIEIPDRVNGNETASEWETRLRASGYTGTITYVVLDPSSADSSAGPDAVTFPLNDTTTTETRSPGDRIQPGDDLTVFKNPPNVPPVAPSGGGSCSCPPLNFTPLTSLGLSSKFPFGVFTYAAAIIGDFNVTPHAPDFNLHAQATGINGHNLDAQYDVNLGDTSLNHVGTPLNTYMGWWRDLLSFAMWVGAIYWIGTKLFGFNGTGDPGEAIDDV